MPFLVGVLVRCQRALFEAYSAFLSGWLDCIERIVSTVPALLIFFLMSVYSQSVQRHVEKLVAVPFEFVVAFVVLS